MTPEVLDFGITLASLIISIVAFIGSCAFYSLGVRQQNAAKDVLTELRVHSASIDKNTGANFEKLLNTLLEQQRDEFVEVLEGAGDDGLDPQEVEKIRQRMSSMEANIRQLTNAAASISHRKHKESNESRALDIYYLTKELETAIERDDQTLVRELREEIEKKKIIGEILKELQNPQESSPVGIVDRKRRGFLKD